METGAQHATSHNDSVLRISPASARSGSAGRPRPPCRPAGLRAGGRGDTVIEVPYRLAERWRRQRSAAYTPRNTCFVWCVCRHLQVSRAMCSFPVPKPRTCGVVHRLLLGRLSSLRLLARPLGQLCKGQLWQGLSNQQERQRPRRQSACRASPYTARTAATNKQVQTCGHGIASILVGVSCCLGRLRLRQVRQACGSEEDQRDGLR